jgi:hypothetical protein
MRCGEQRCMYRWLTCEDGGLIDCSTSHIMMCRLLYHSMFSGRGKALAPGIVYGVACHQRLVK